jgi:hypothetical protein
VRHEGESLLDEEFSLGDALFGWLRAFIAHVAAKQELALAIPNDRGGHRSALFDRWHKSMRVTASQLLSRAQRAGSIRAEVDASDLLALAAGIAVAGTDDDHIERSLGFLRYGIAADGGPSKP